MGVWSPFAWIVSISEARYENEKTYKTLVDVHFDLACVGVLGAVGFNKIRGKRGSIYAVVLVKSYTYQRIGGSNNLPFQLNGKRHPNVEE